MLERYDKNLNLNLNKISLSTKWVSAVNNRLDVLMCESVSKSEEKVSFERDIRTSFRRLNERINIFVHNEIENENQFKWSDWVDWLSDNEFKCFSVAFGLLLRFF